jgi:hypothetical protein
MYLDAFREQAFAPALPPARQGGAARFRLHARTKTVLAFACALRWLVSPFHKTENNFGAFESGYSRNRRGIVNRGTTMWMSILHSRIATASNF